MIQFISAAYTQCFKSAYRFSKSTCVRVERWVKNARVPVETNCGAWCRRYAQYTIVRCSESTPSLPPLSRGLEKAENQLRYQKERAKEGGETVGRRRVLLCPDYICIVKSTDSTYSIRLDNGSNPFPAAAPAAPTPPAPPGKHTE